MISEDVFVFLKETPPFRSLDDDTLRNLAAEVSPAFYPRGHVIVTQDGPAAEHLSVIKEGEVKLFVSTNEGEEVRVAYRTKGHFFGLLSIVCGDISRDTVVATRDASCYLLKKESVLSLMKKDPEFAEYCFRVLLKRLLDLTYSEIHRRTLLYGAGDKLLFTNYVCDLATREVVTASEDISIREAAEIMTEKNISSLILLDSDGLPVGLITDRDMRRKVVSKGRDAASRVGDIMSFTLIKSEARDYCFEALLKMIRYDIHHLLVVGGGDLKGIITSHDLMRLQASSPLSVAGEIGNQSTIDGLVPVSKKIDRIITMLIREGAKASTVTRIITEINDTLVKKVIELAESRLGPPPVDYCWIVFGSEGRKEQTFRTDQDNAIIYDDTDGPESEEVADYFAGLSLFIKEALSKCGFPACSADYMASNPRWRRPLSAWKRYFGDWINIPNPEAILHSLIFFDFRPVHGNFLIAEKLRSYTWHQLKEKRLFFTQMAGVVSQNRPPLDLFGRFTGVKEGPHKGAFNSKINALCPIIDAARFSALETGIYLTSTIERLRALKERAGTVSAFSEELEQAFEFLMSMRLNHQFRQMEEGLPPENFISPEGLAGLDRKMLKESFRVIIAVQAAMLKKYRV